MARKLTLVQRKGRGGGNVWSLFAGNADSNLVKRWARPKSSAVRNAKKYLNGGYYDKLYVYKTNGELDEVYGSEAADYTDPRQLEPGFKLQQSPGPDWKVRKVHADGHVKVQRVERGRARDEYRTLSPRDLAGMGVWTPQDTRDYWSDYSKEGGHHIM